METIQGSCVEASHRSNPQYMEKDEQMRDFIHIKQIYNKLCENSYTTPSIDIMEHLPTLYKYAKECDSIFETGVRGCVSSWAFLYGLLDREDNKKRFLYMNDIDECDIELLLNTSNEFEDKVEIKYEWKNNLKLDITQTFDITFIDTWHIYGQLKRELEKFSKFTNKYIIMHDTTVDEKYGEFIRNNASSVICEYDEKTGHNMYYEFLDNNCKKEVISLSNKSGFPVHEILCGLEPAIQEFLVNHPEWYVKEKYTNNHGLTILARK